MKLPCIVCDRQLDVQNDGQLQLADDSVICNTVGNYGSRVLDDPPYIVEFLICDRCFFEKRKSLSAYKTIRATYERADPLEYMAKELPAETAKALPIKIACVTTNASLLICEQCHTYASAGQCVNTSFYCNSCASTMNL